MKRIYTFLLLSLFVWSAAMAEVVSGTCGANGDNLTWTLDTETGALVISGEGAMANYEWNTFPWYSYKSNIVSVEITDGVTTIGEYAFRYCPGLTNLTIPNSVTTIGNYAFFDCSGLTSLTIPNSVTTIGGSAFRGCSGLTSISVADDNPYYDSRNDCNAIIETASNTLVAGCKNTVIPNSVTEIGNGAFDCCVGLMNLTIPNSVTTIGDLAFWNCSGLTSLTIPNSVTTIGNCAFYGCSGLTSLTIPNSVTTIGDRAFYDCSGLTSLTIPNSVTTIEFGAFASCSGLTSISVVGDNPYYDSRNDCNAIIETASNTLVAGCKNTEIPNSVTTIGGGAFGGCSDLTSLTIPNSVTKIGDYAFEGCSGLTSLTIPNSVTKIGEYAFRSCSGLTSLTMKSATPPYTGSDVFSYCYDLTTIYVPFGTTSNYDVAPWNSYNIVEMSTKVQVDNLWYNLDFENQTAEVTNSGTTGEYSGSIVIPGSISVYGETFVVTAIGQSAFRDCSGLTSLTIPNSVTTIGYWIFNYCDGLTNISVADDNPYYDSRNDCNAIIETASNTLVAGCKNTEIPNSVTTIGNRAFDCCRGLTSLTIPNSVTTIEDYAFWGCSDLTSLTIPNSVTTIGEEAFWGCSGLTSLTIPNSVTTIGGDAFWGCSGLTSLTMKSATPPSTGSDAFYNCDALTTIYVPFGAAANYDVAPWNSYEIVEALGVVSSNPATGEEVEGLSVITLTFNKEIKSINESLIKLTATSSSTQVPVSVQINATNTKALTITLSQAAKDRDTYVLTLAAGAVTAMDDKSNEEALEMSYVVTTKPLEDVDLSKLYRIKDVGTGLYLNAANYDVHEVGTHGGVNAVEKANSDDQVFTISKDGNNFKLQTASGKYIYCQGWNVDALDEGTALTFVPAEEGAFYIMRGSQYFKIEEVESVYYPFCDAPESKRAKFVLEEVVRVALTDGEDYTQAAEMEAERITYTRNFKNTYYQPWYVPFDVEYDEIIDRFVVAELNDIHQFDDNDDGEFERWAIEVLRLKSGDVISANHPYMIKAKTTGEQSIVVENTTLYPATLNTIDCSSTKMLYTFEPTYTTLSGSVLREEGCYVVGSGKLVMPTEGSVVKANRWYLRPEPRNGGSLLSAPKQIQIFERDENGLTDIEAAIEESEQTTWPADVYDLNGRLVRKAATNMDGLNKGMYIVNGKKIVK